jgi:putative SOS response-associated peptidase YedK
MCNHFKVPFEFRQLPRDLEFRGSRALKGGDAYPSWVGGKERPVPILRRQDGDIIVDEIPWGIPLAAGTTTKPVTNIRNLQSPFWRGTLAKPEFRCIVPAVQFAEWTPAPDPETGRKREIWFSMVDDQPFMFAGAWRPSNYGPRFAFLTCEANDLVRPIHPKAMPVILHEDQYKPWLDGEPVEQFQACFPTQLMKVAG